MRYSIGLAALLAVVATGQPAAARHHSQDDSYGAPLAIFYTKDYFGGRSFTADHEVRKMGSKDMEDNVSSIRVVRGVWQICVDDNFQGRCEIVDHSIRTLTDLHMDDKISSVRPVPPGGWNQPGGYAPPPPHY